MFQEDEDLKGIGAAPETQEQTSVAYEVSEEEKEDVEKYVQESIANRIFCVNGFKIKANYPKAFEKYKETVLAKVNPQFINKNAPSDDIVHSALLYSARIILPEFFDDNKVYMNIHGSNDTWKYTMDVKSSYYVSPEFKDRIAAEVAGYEASFAELEKLL